MSWLSGWLGLGSHKSARRGGVVLDTNHGLINTGTLHGNVYVTAAGERRPLSDPALPWREPTAESDLFALLGWQSRLTALIGRERERAILLDWARQGQGIAAKLLIGEGGVGKTRLAVEVAETLRGDGWAAGFADLRMSGGYRTGARGTLLLVDYPEENRRAVCDLLRRLAGQESQQPLRLLLLSRKWPELWQKDIDDCGAAGLFGLPLELLNLAAEAPYAVFCGARAKLAAIMGSGPPAVSEDAFAEWLTRDPLHRRPLFVVAAALHNVRHPDTLDFRGPEITAALVRRERRRLRNESRQADLGEFTLERLAACAAVTGGLDAEQIRRLAGRNGQLDLGLPDAAGLIDRLNATGRLTKTRLPAPGPDVIAAWLLADVFGERPDRAGEWLWGCLEMNFADGLERLGRLAYDAEVTLGLRQPRMGEWLATVVQNDVGRCRDLDPFVAEANPPIGLLPAAVAVWRTLAEQAADEAERARCLVNLSNDLAASGDHADAQDAICEAVHIFRHLAATNPDRFAPVLAISLNTLSLRLADTGDPVVALDTCREAVDILRPLAEADPARFEPNLARSLNNLSLRLRDTGGPAAALGTCREAVAIRRRLAKADPARFEPDLALSLNNFSNLLAATGDSAALATIRQAVAIRRRLAAASPARFAPDFAQSLINLSNRLADTGESADFAAALAAISEAEDILRPLAMANPTRFAPHLALTLNNISDRLADTGDLAAALDTIEEAITLITPYAKAFPQGLHGRWLAVMQENRERLKEQMQKK